MRVTARKMIEYYERQIGYLKKKELDKPLPTYSDKTPGFEKRLRVHRHNGFQGSCAMAQSFLSNVMISESTTFEAKKQASRLTIGMRELREMLKERID